MGERASKLALLLPASFRMKPANVRIQDDRLNRISGFELEFPNRWDIPKRVFANVFVQLAASDASYANGQIHGPNGRNGHP